MKAAPASRPTVDSRSTHYLVPSRQISRVTSKVTGARCMKQAAIATRRERSSRSAERPRLPVLTLYGHHEKAWRGYNPQTGPAIVSPPVLLRGPDQRFWHGDLRAGDVHTASGTVWLLRACFAKLPATVCQIRVRGDAGFFDCKVVRTISHKWRVKGYMRDSVRGHSP